MIKNLKRIAVLVVTAALAAVGSLSAAADGYILYAGYSFSLNNRQATIHSYEGSGELYIPASIWGYTVVGIEDFAFYGRDDFDKVELRESNHRQQCVLRLYRLFPCGAAVQGREPRRMRVPVLHGLKDSGLLRRTHHSHSKTNLLQLHFAGGGNASCQPANHRRLGVWKLHGARISGDPAQRYRDRGHRLFGDENLTLGVWLDSYAHTFAKENGCAYRLLDPVTLGDANGDGFVNINDVTALQQHLAELQELSDLGAKAADINMDNKLEIEDATTLQMFLAEYVLSYPVGETV